MAQHQVYNGSLIKTTLRHRGDKRTTKTSRIHTHKRLYITVLGNSSFSKVHKMQQSYRVRRTVGDYVRQRFPPTAVKGACCSSCLADEDKQRYHQQRQKHREYTHSEIPQGFTPKRLIPLRKPDKIHFCWKSTGGRQSDPPDRQIRLSFGAWPHSTSNLKFYGFKISSGNNSARL